MKGTENEEDETDRVRNDLKERIVVDLPVSEYVRVVRAHSDVWVELVSGGHFCITWQRLAN